MSFYKDKYNKVHYLESDKDNHMLPKGSIKITAKEADKIQRMSVNHDWDVVAKAWGFDASKAVVAQASIINAACAAAIVGGFSSSALGTAHTYDSAMEDQLNLIGAAGANIDLLYTCTDAAGLKDAVLHTAAQLKQVYADGVTHKTTQLSKARALKVQLDILAANPASTQADIDAVIW